MHLDCKVKIQEADGKISKELIKGTTYIYNEYARFYLKDKQYNTPKQSCFGKQVSGQPALMMSNQIGFDACSYYW